MYGTNKDILPIKGGTNKDISMIKDRIEVVTQGIIYGTSKQIFSLKYSPT